jgi:PAS domain S-box-containing protein
MKAAEPNVPMAHKLKPTLLERSRHQLARFRSSVLLPFLVLGVSLTTTGVWWFLLTRQDDENARAEFESQARESSDEIRDELMGFADVLQAGAGLLAVSDTVSPEGWRRFVERFDLPHAYPGIEAVNYAEQVKTAGLDALTQRMRTQVGADFRIWPPGSRGEHAVTVLIEPFGGTNIRAMGFDLMSEPTRRQALERARDTGTVTLSNRVNLVQDVSAKPRPGLLMVVPLYRRDRTSTTVEERRTALTGYVSAAFRVDEVVTGVLRKRTLPLSLSIWEGERTVSDALIYSTTRAGQASTTSRVPIFSTDVPLSLSGQKWSLRFSVPKRAALVQSGNAAIIALAAGIPLSLLLFGLTWSEATLRARATRLANEMTQEVRKQAQLLDLTHDTVFLRDKNNVIRYWNRAATDTYGFSAEDAIGRTADDLLQTRFPRPLDQIWRELESTDRWQGELVHTRRDGTEIVVASRWAIQRDAQGGIESILETNNDITERRRAEQDRRRLEASLLQAQKLEAMGTLAGGVAHDFNNILGAVLGYGELAQNSAPPDSALRRYVDNMMSAGQRAKSLVERILAFSRSGVGPRVPVHVQSIVVEALEMLSASLPDNIRLEQALTADNSAVIGDATQIHQVVLNLCTNAVQAMKSGGTLEVRLDVVKLDAPRTVITGVLPPAEYVQLCVHDTGSGIEPQLRDRIFDPFFTTKGVGVGTGLGLSLVHGIVIDLGGGVDMASEVGRGTMFSVFLPQRGHVDPAADADESIPRGNGAAVMLVDDEETLVRLGEEMIAGFGYEAVGFTSAVEALEEFRADPQRFAAVLSDETMPGMTGSQLTEKIVAIRPDMPVILMSGYAGPTLGARARSVGARDVLSKPLAARDIARALAMAVAGGGAHANSMSAVTPAASVEAPE